MALHSLDQIISLKDPLKQYQCRFIISNGMGTTLSSLFTKNNVIKDGTFELRCTSFTLPGTKIKTTDLVLNNHVRKRAAMQDKSGVWKVSVTEDSEGNVAQSIKNWCDIIHNPVTSIQAPSASYVSMATIEILGANGEVNRKFYLRGLYPLSIRETKIDTSSSNAVQILM